MMEDRQPYRWKCKTCTREFKISSKAKAKELDGKEICCACIIKRRREVHLALERLKNR